MLILFISFEESLLISIISIILFGPNKIIEILRDLGFFIRKINNITNNIKNNILKNTENIKNPIQNLKNNFLEKQKNINNTISKNKKD